ncbi:MAG: hypothetical protein RRY29_06145 [Desulfovibrionaceae bacterium]
MSYCCKKYWKDFVLVLCLAVFAAFVQHGRMGASIDGIDLATDQAMYTSMIAARMMPEAFTADAFYSNTQILDIYRLIHFPLIEALVEQGKFGLAYLKLTGAHVFLHYLSFYLLGMLLLKKRWAALFFTVLMGQAYWIPWGTYWGCGYLDYSPRVTFSALYGFLLCAALRVWDKPRWWPLVLFAAGLMVYVHAISAVPVLAGLWLGFAALKPRKSTWPRHALWMLLVGLCGLAGIGPYVFHYVRPSLALTAADVSLLKEVMLLRFDYAFTYYWHGLGKFLWQHIRLGLFPLAAAGGYCIYRLGNAEERRTGLQILLWSLGPVLVTGIFLLDQYVAVLRQAPPLQFDLIRTLRFLPFFAICLTLLGLKVAFRCLTPQQTKALWAARVIALGVGVGLFLGGNNDLVRTSVLYYWNSADPQRYARAYADTLERKTMLEALRTHTPAGATIFYPHEDEAIRHYALRPLVFAWKDVGSLYYAKAMPELRQWATIYRQLLTSPTAYIRLARQTGAEYLLSNRPQDRELLLQTGTIVWENSTYILVRL